MDSISLSRKQAPAGHRRGSTEYRRLLAALFCAGIATFAQLYSPQGVLPQISADLGVGAASAALMVSACTIGLADRCHPLVDDRRPHRPGEGDVGVGHHGKRPRSAHTIRTELSPIACRTAAGGTRARWRTRHRDRVPDRRNSSRARGSRGGYLRRRDQHRRPPGPGDRRPDHRHRDVACRHVRRGRAVRRRCGGLRQTRAAVTRFHAVERAAAPTRRAVSPTASS